MAREQVTFIICDRCGGRGNTIGMELHTASVPGKWANHVDMGPAGGYDVIDLCADCREEFMAWLVGGVQLASVPVALDTVID
jgi:hypothetical protein